jgi:hypothetical protein
MFQAERHIEKGKSVRKVGRAVKRIDIPPIGALEPGTGSLFAEDAMLGKVRVQARYDEFF